MLFSAKPKVIYCNWIRTETKSQFHTTLFSAEVSARSD